MKMRDMEAEAVFQEWCAVVVRSPHPAPRFTDYLREHRAHRQNARERPENEGRDTSGGGVGSGVGQENESR